MGERSDVSMDSAPGGFSGTERFVLEGRLGEGGMGVVYRVRDREHGRLVALKTMTHVDPGSLLRFKKEFRALADITHPNVVDLYELGSEGEHWFFTMELVDGVDFLAWVQESAPRSSRPSGPRSIARRLDARSAEAPTLDAGTLDGVLPDSPASPRGALSCCVRNPERLRAALRQLVEGVIAIHGAGKLHRDIKPSNVLVTRDGRVVLLDFGVVGDYVPGRSGDPRDDALLGTPAYMAPEQAQAGGTLPASDFYGIGAILFEALTDDLPFIGTPRQILNQKRECDAPPPSARVSDVPVDLDELCVELLARDPALRPTGEDVLRRLGGAGRRTRSVITPTGRQGAFVGRRAQLEELDRALAASREGRPAVVFVNGRSGMGKTALVQQYFERLKSDPDVLLLAGRCYERESVPFKGLDSVVDEVSRFLMRLPDAHAASLVPDGIHELSRVFPVLKSVCAVGAQPLPEHPVVDPREIRRRAFAALKRLLSLLASQWSVVVHIDDLHWSDVDSAGLITELLAPPDPPPLLLVCGYRDELAEDSAAVQELLGGMQHFEQSGTLRRVVVERLSEAEAIELAKSSVETGPVPTADLLRAIAEESQGVPFFVAELARWQSADSGSGAQGRRPVSLEQVIGARVEALPPASRKLLSVVAVAGGPLEHSLAGRVARIGAQGRVAENVLRSQRLVKGYSHLDREVLDTFHARVRETVIARLGADEKRALHLELADALESGGQADPEALLEHLLAAGERQRARRYAVPAARAAADGLAFLRAARLYRLAIELDAEAEPYRLHRKLADALANAGHSAKAAEAYLAGAQAAPAEQGIEMRRLAAEHYLKSGREQQGLVLLKAVLAEVGLSFPRSTAAALASLLVERARLGIRRLDPERTRWRGSERDLLEIDVAFSAAVGLSMFDLVRGANFSARHLRLALSAGEPVRLCRGLALEAANTVAVGDGSRERSERHVRMAEALATRADDPHGIALAKLTAGLVRFFVGEWRSATKVLDEASSILRERCSAVAWELANAEAWSCNSLILMGELRESSRRAMAFVKEAQEREDRYALVNMIYAACIAHVVADDVDAAWRVTTEDGGFYTPSGFTAGHWGALISAISVHRYRGEGARALARARRDWKPLERSQLLRVNVIRLTSLFERGLCAVAAAEASSDAAQALREAEHHVSRLRRERLGFARPLGEHLAACVAAARSDRIAAERALSRAVAGLERADMGYLASCARYRRGQVLGGDEGQQLVAEAASWFEAQGVKNARRCLAMSAPGFSRWCD